MLYDFKNIDFDDANLKCDDDTYGSIKNDDSPIFRELFLLESFKSNSLNKNKKLKFFLGSSNVTNIDSIDCKETMLLGFGFGLLSLGLLMLFGVIANVAVDTGFFIVGFFIMFGVGCFYIRNLVIKSTFSDLKLDVLKTAELKSLVKEYLKDFERLLNSDLDNENKDILEKVFCIVNSIYDLTYEFEDVSEWDICYSYIRLLQEKSPFALETGKHLLELLEVAYIYNLFDSICVYIEYLEKYKNDLIGYSYAGALRIRTMYENLPRKTYLIYKIMQNMSYQEILRIIELGNDINKFVVGTISNENVKLLNESIFTFLNSTNNLIYFESAKSF